MRIVSILFAALLAVAFTAPAAAETKIGVLDPAQLSRAPEFKAAEARLTSEFQKRQDEINNERKKLDDDIGRFRRERDTMSSTQRTNAENDLNTRTNSFDLKQRQFADDVQRRRLEIQRDVNGRLQRAIKEVAKEKGLDLIIENAAYFALALDVTPAVMAKLAAMEGQPAPAADPKKDSNKKK